MLSIEPSTRAVIWPSGKKASPTSPKTCEVGVWICETGRSEAAKIELVTLPAMYAVIWPLAWAVGVGGVAAFGSEVPPCIRLEMFEVALLK